MESVARVRSPSPPKARIPVKVPQRFKSPEPPSKMAEQFRSPELPQAALNSELMRNSEQEQNGVIGQNIINGTASGNIKLPGTSTNQMGSTENQVVTRNKVVKMVRHVVRKVMPTEEDEATVPTQPSDKIPEEAKSDAEPVKTVPAPASASKASVMPGFSFKHDVIKTEDRDDISQGLTNFMVRGRRRDLRQRLRKDEGSEKIGLEKKIEKKEIQVESEETKAEKKENKTTLKPQKVNHKPTSSTPVTHNSPVGTGNPTSVASSKLTHSRPSSLPPIVGFIPAPKPSSLSPPPGFIPAPKPNASTKPTPANLPSTTPVAQKSSSLSSSRFFPAPKHTPVATSVSPDPPPPLNPPPTIIPIQQPVVSQQEVQCPYLACLVNI